jgi:5'(3')-deoxyribonucleotidase
LVEVILDYWDDSGICVLTHAVTPAAAAGKIVWMKLNFPILAHRILIVTGPKSVVRPGYADILIDDCDENIRLWEPGYGITVPQTWNKLHAVDVLPHVEAQLKGYFNERFRS